MISVPPDLFPAWDDSLFVLLNNRAHAPWLDAVMRGLTDTSSFRPLMYGLALLPVLLLRGRARVTWLVAWISVALGDLCVHHVLKPWLHRPRPLDAGLPVRALTALRHTFGFPSAHAANFAALAGAFAARRSRLAVPAAALALIVGYSRVYVGVHRPLDVLGGWMVGALVGVAVAAAWTTCVGVLERRR
ncbi:MAG: phosphatase PAP2 family protein [Candidatus Eisenbacteria bacterium]|nr:phosphatase PAP2 family protein [Candidatus Eisenbacteria bacterium]